MLAFGPVPSRRLGRSLGINNIPPKVCTYSCVYCQAGKTTRMQVDRTPFYNPQQIYRDVRKKVEKAQKKGEPVDYLTFVPDGEPTLDIHIDREIDLLRCLGIKIAVITNAALIWREDVREALYRADWVSLKIDATRPHRWHRINRPHRILRLAAILDGMQKFAKLYRGKLVVETMLVKGVNDSPTNTSEVAEFIDGLEPVSAYLSVPTRPPSEKRVQPPDEKTFNATFQTMSEKFNRVESLIGYEGNAFAYTGDAAKDLLSITAVHPMRQDAVNDFLMRAGEDWQIVRELMAQDRLVKTKYRGQIFYMRTFERQPQPESASGGSVNRPCLRERHQNQ
jgi:wyosine [tRNA(Phe)-imidazoG37] synthetase (radical SAM superfamily)